MEWLGGSGSEQKGNGVRGCGSKVEVMKSMVGRGGGGKCGVERVEEGWRREGELSMRTGKRRFSLHM